MVDPKYYEYNIETDYKSVREYTTLEWTTEPPMQDGVYWVRVRQEYETEHVIIIANVSIMSGNVSLYFPVGGYECEEVYDAKFATHWLGPLPVPESPKNNKGE